MTCRGTHDTGVGRLLLIASERRLSTAQLLAGAVDPTEGLSAIFRYYRLA